LKFRAQIFVLLFCLLGAWQKKKKKKHLAVVHEDV